MATTDEIGEPVIASSNRCADVGPYVKGLFAEDPQRWMQVLPWEFPQNGTKEQEEDFLRTFFTDREIRMQGGADPPGNGFRFLKQVWYSAALWNLEHRIPAIVDWWFEHNQELLNDPAMKQHMLSGDAQASTFFAADEIKMYGEKLLYWAVKQVQFRLNQQDQSAAPDNIKVPAQADTHGTQETQISSKQPTATVADQAALVSAADLAPPAPQPNITVPPAIIPIAAGHDQGFPKRNFSSGSYPAEERGQTYRKGRGAYGNKRQSFNQGRPNQRPPHAFGDPRQASYSFSPYGPPPAQLSPMVPGPVPTASRLPSGGPYPSTIGPMPPLPQGQQFHGPPPPAHSLNSPLQPQYGQPMPHMQPQPPMIMHSSSGLQQGGMSSAYMQPQPFADRSNVHVDTRYLGNEQAFFGMEDKPDYRTKRRDSVQSRGGRSRGGYGGSMRGRGSRGRNSFSAEGQFAPRVAPNETDSASFPQRERRFSFQRDNKNWRRTDWQPQASTENSLPHGMGHPIPEHGFHTGPQMAQYGRVVSGPNSTNPPPGFGTSSHVHGNSGDRKPPFQRQVQPCMGGCTKENISDICTTATKLIVFNVHPGLDENELMQYFSQFGKLLWVSPPKQSQVSVATPGVTPKYYLWVQYAEVAGARRCLASKGAQWPGGSLLLEVAKEHWDPNHVPLASNYPRPPPMGGPMPLAGPPSVAAPPPRKLPESLPQRPEPPVEKPAHDSGHTTPVAVDPSVSDSATAPNTNTLRDTTPTTSGVSTPKKKPPKRKGGRKRGGAAQTPARENGSDAEDRSAKAQEGSNTSGTPPPPSDEDKEVKQSESTSPPPLDGPAADAGAAGIEAADEADHQATERDDSTPTASNAQPAPTAEQQQPPASPTEEAEVAVEGPAPTNRQDEEQNDDSFHTASGSPEVEKEAVLGEGEVAPPNVVVGSENGVEQDKTSASFSDVGSTHSSNTVVEKASDKGPSPSKDVKKAPIPQVPAQKSVTISLPHVDTEKAKALDKSEVESLQVPGQRSTSEGSEATTPAFVTAPNTPAIPEPAPEPRSKKAPKHKGPEQTESLSIFAKSKRKASKAVNNKKPTGKGNRSGHQAAGGSEPNNPGPEDENNFAGPQGLKKSDPRGSTSKEQNEQDAPDPAYTNTGVNDPSSSLGDVSPRDSPVAPPVIASSGKSSFSNILAGVWRSASPKQPSVVPQVTKELADVARDDAAKIPEKNDAKAAGRESEDGSDTMAPTDPSVVPSAQSGGEKNEEQKQEQEPVGLGISAPKTNKKKNNKKKKKVATAEVTEMSHPGHDNHSSRPTYEFKGNDVGSDASSQKTDSGGGSPARGIAQQLNKSQARNTDHATDANDSDMRSRPAPGAKSSNADRASAEVGSNASEQGKIIEAPPQKDSPDVASSKEKMEQLKAQERMRKEATKSKAKEADGQ